MKRGRDRKDAEGGFGPFLGGQRSATLGGGSPRPRGRGRGRGVRRWIREEGGSYRWMQPTRRWSAVNGPAKWASQMGRLVQLDSGLAGTQSTNSTHWGSMGPGGAWRGQARHPEGADGSGRGWRRKRANMAN